MMVAVSTIMYTTSYLARDCKCFELFYKILLAFLHPMLSSCCFSAFFILDKNVQHRQEIQALALKEYYEKHGGAPDHH